MTTPIATLAELKAFIGSTATTTSDSVLQTILDGGVLAIGNYCNRDFSAKQSTDYFRAKGGQRFTLSGYPVISIMSATVDGSAASASVVGVRTAKITSSCPRGADVIVTYMAGYGDDGNINPWPKDLKLALLQYCKAQYEDKKHIGTNQQRLAGQMVRFNNGELSEDDGIPAATRTILQNYLNSVPGY